MIICKTGNPLFNSQWPASKWQAPLSFGASQMSGVGGGRGWHHWRSTGDLLARRGCLLLCDIKYNVITFWRSNCITISQQVHNVRWAANIINNNQIRICFEQQRQMFPAGFRIKLLLSLNINLNRKKYIKKWHFFWENLFFWFYPDLHWNIKSDSHPH